MSYTSPSPVCTVLMLFEGALSKASCRGRLSSSHEPSRISDALLGARRLHRRLPSQLRGPLLCSCRHSASLPKPQDRWHTHPWFPLLSLPPPSPHDDAHPVPSPILSACRDRPLSARTSSAPCRKQSATRRRRPQTPKTPAAAPRAPTAASAASRRRGERQRQAAAEPPLTVRGRRWDR